MKKLPKQHRDNLVHYAALLCKTHTKPFNTTTQKELNELNIKYDFSYQEYNFIFKILAKMDSTFVWDKQFKQNVYDMCYPNIFYIEEPKQTDNPLWNDVLIGVSILTLIVIISDIFLYFN